MLPSPWTPFVFFHCFPAGNIAPTTNSGKALQAFVSIFGILGLAFPVGILGKELANAYTKLFKKLKDASDAKERERLKMFAAKAAASAAAATSSKRSTIRMVRGLVERGFNPSLGSDKAQAAREAERRREARRYFLAMNFKKAVVRFTRGEFPLFPPGTRLAVAQAHIHAEIRAEQLEKQRDRIGSLQRKYDRALVARPVRRDKLPGPVTLVYGSIAEGTRSPRKASTLFVGHSHTKSVRKLMSSSKEDDDDW